MSSHCLSPLIVRIGIILARAGLQRGGCERWCDRERRVCFPTFHPDRRIHSETKSRTSLRGRSGYQSNNTWGLACGNVAPHVVAIMQLELVATMRGIRLLIPSAEPAGPRVRIVSCGRSRGHLLADGSLITARWRRLARASRGRSLAGSASDPTASSAALGGARLLHRRRRARSGDSRPGGRGHHQALSPRHRELSQPQKATMHSTCCRHSPGNSPVRLHEDHKISEPDSTFDRGPR